MSLSKICVVRDNFIGRITISNPAKRNAMSLEMWHDLAKAMDALGASEDIRVIVVSGAGNQAFVSGADISRFGAERAHARAAAAYSTAVDRAVSKLAGTSKPVIAMINGACFGAGMDIAACCDIRICSDHAVFGVPAARMGLGYTLEGLKRLAHIVGFASARELLLTGRRISADRAHHIRFVNRVVPGDDLEMVVQDEARGLAENAPLSLRAAKVGFALLENGVTEEGLDEHQRLVALSNDSEDYREGIRAFTEKRPPVFLGR